MSNQLVNFAIAKSIYSEKRNYLDTFSPFVLKVISENGRTIDLNQIEAILLKDFALKIPINTLKSILSLLANQKFIDLNKQPRNYSCCVTPNGSNYALQTIENEKNIRRGHQKFWESFLTFSKEKYNIDYEFSGLEKKVIDFIDENIFDLISYTLNNEEDLLTQKGDNSFSHHFSDFISNIEKNDNQLYDTFQEILKGSILWNEIAHKENIEKETDFNNLVIYLDTNYLLSLLGLDSTSINKGAKQLHQLLINNKKIVLKVFTITLDEVIRVLTEYKKQRGYYLDVPVNDIFYYLKEYGYDEAKIDLLIANLGKKCDELGISIEENKMIEPSKFSDSEKELYDKLYRSNTYQNEKQSWRQRKEETIHLSTLHDVTIIFAIRKKRGIWIGNLENAKSIFLTSSTRLNAFVNKLSQANNHFPETILDLTMTNILWLKNPTNDIGCSLQHIISLHAKNIFINHRIWKSFVHTLKELKEENRINDEDYAHLISNNQITLSFLKGTKTSEITPQRVLELHAKIKAENIVNAEIIKSADKKIMQQNLELERQKKNTSTLQRELDKIKNLFDSERKSKQTLADEVSELRRKIEEKETEERKAKEIEYQIEEKVKHIGKRLLIFLIWCLVVAIGLYFIQGIVMGLINSKEKTLSLFILWSIWIIVYIIITIVLNKMSAEEFSTKVLWIFNRKKLREKLLMQIENNSN